MSKGSPLRRLVRVTRDYGIIIAAKVVYSKIRGMLRPDLALPEAVVYDAPQHEVSILLDAATQDAATLHAVFVVLSGRRDEPRWEVCVCERLPLADEMARVLDRWRGAQPWIRMATADVGVPKEVAARWTVEQATGEFVGLLAPGSGLSTDSVSRLVVELRRDPTKIAAMLIAPEQVGACQLLLLRKSTYLMAAAEEWPLAADACIGRLEEIGTPVFHVTDEAVGSVSSVTRA